MNTKIARFLTTLTIATLVASGSTVAMKRSAAQAGITIPYVLVHFTNNTDRTWTLVQPDFLNARVVPIRTLAPHEATVFQLNFYEAVSSTPTYLGILDVISPENLNFNKLEEYNARVKRILRSQVWTASDSLSILEFPGTLWPLQEKLMIKINLIGTGDHLENEIDIEDIGGHTSKKQM